MPRNKQLPDSRIDRDFADVRLLRAIMEAVERAQKRICEEWIEGYEQWTPEGVTRHRHKDCVHIQLPASMHIPPRTNEEYRKYFSKLLAKSIKNFKTKWRILVNDAKNNVAVLHITATSGSAIGPYENEYIFVMWFTPSGEEITRIEETVDSKVTTEFFARLNLASKANPPAKL